MTRPTDLRRDLGPVGIWTSFDGIPTGELVAYARTVEDLGFPALWINESIGREPFAVLGALARETSRLVLGLGVAAVHARDAAAARNGARTVADLSGGRFVMGLGVSHRSSAERRGHGYERPLAAMTVYLDAYDAAPWSGPTVTEPPLVLAALGDRMLALAATRAAGAFPFLVPVERVAHARGVVDAAAVAAGRPVLVVAQLAILGSGPEVRETARGAMARYLGQPAYRDNALRGGFSEADVEARSDPLVDALVVTGDAADLRARVAELHDAGADHVAVIPLSTEGRQADVATTRAVAPG